MAEGTRGEPGRIFFAIPGLCDPRQFCVKWASITKSIQKLRMTTSAPVVNQLSTRVAAIAVTLMFVVNGAVLGGFGGSLPSLRDKLGLDATQIAIPNVIPVTNSRLPLLEDLFATSNAPRSAPAPIAIVIQL